MDTFVEQIVKKKKDGKDIALIVGIWILFVIVSAAAVLFLRMLGFLILCGAGYGAWWLTTERNREFEYSLTNGSIDIDEIIAQRKRKRIVSVNGEKLESAGVYDAAAQNRPFDRRVMAAPSETEEGLWYFTYHSKKNGHTAVVFQPDNRVLSALYSGLQTTVRLETDRALREKGITVEKNPRRGE